MGDPTYIFVNYLAKLKKLVIKVKESESKHQDILFTKLQSDMFPLHQQITTAISFSLRCCCALSKRDIATFNDRIVSCDNLIKEIGETIIYLERIPKNNFLNYEYMELTIEAGFAKKCLNGRDFIDIYAIPNFIFHISMAYAILRNIGLDISKGDFDGIHHYPQGFHF